MAIKWVRASGGNDGNTGNDFDNAWATIAQFYTYLNASGVAGDTLNIVNDGPHTMPLASSAAITAALGGTSYAADPGFIMRGTDSSGAVALATVQTGTTDSRFIHIRTGTSYVRIEGLFLDMSPLDPGEEAGIINLSFGDGPVRLRACRIKGFDDNAANYGDTGRSIYIATSNPPNDWGEIEYCVVENCPRPTFWALSPTGHQASIHNSVLWINNDLQVAQPDIWSWDPTNSASNAIGFYNNTYSFQTTSQITSLLTTSPTADSLYGEVNWHSNVFWVNTTSNIPLVFAGKTGTGSAATWTGTIGSNVLYFGPDVASGDVTTLYQTPWTATGDNVAYEQVATILFNDPASTWIWENVDGSGYDLLVPADMRLLILTDQGLGGTIPGALPGLTIPPTPDPDEDNIPFLDVLPFYAPVLKLDLNTRMSTRVNRNQQFYVRKDIEGQLWREYSSRRFSVAPGTIDPVQGGIETAKVVMMESDAAVQLNASTQFSKFLPSAKTVILSGGQYSVVEVKNPDATDTAKVLISAVDKVAT